MEQGKPKIHHLSRDVFKYDYHTTAWDRLISKTQKQQESAAQKGLSTNSRNYGMPSQKVITPTTISLPSQVQMGDVENF